MTGVKAERHGLIYWTATAARDFWSRRDSGGVVVALTDVRHPTVFRILSNAGVRVASLNMPVTFPPLALDGVMVSGFLAPTDLERVASPPGFLDRYPDYRVDVAQAPDGAPIPTRTDAEVAGYARDMARMAEARHRVFLDLLSDGFGLASIVYVGSDRLSHVAWPQVNAILTRPGVSEGERAVESYYRLLDRLLGETRRAASDALLLITSDHGQGPAPPRCIAPNVWLRQRGWLVGRGETTRRLSHLIARPSLRARLWKSYRKRRNIPRGSMPFIDRKRTVAYGIPMSHCRVMGVAVRGDRPLQEEIARELLAITDPETGSPPVRDVLFASEICDEHGLSTYPELIAVLNQDYGCVGSLDGPVVGPAAVAPSGYHEPDGIVMALGAGITPGAHPAADISDIAPTILTFFGIAPSEVMDGAAIPWIVNGSQRLLPVLADAEPTREDALTDGEEEEIAEHLRDLGYVD
jgi:predicted AlkP superfamily phosphohydrolase/phosphomutase